MSCSMSSRAVGTISPFTRSRASFTAIRFLAEALSSVSFLTVSFSAAISGSCPVSSKMRSPLAATSIAATATIAATGATLDGAACISITNRFGDIVDVNDAPLSGVNVAAFRTYDNAVAGITVQSREDGSYAPAAIWPDTLRDATHLGAAAGVATRMSSPVSVEVECQYHRD